MDHHTLPDKSPMRTVKPLSEEFLNTLVAELDNDEIVGIIFGGSYARNEATPFSDVDIACFVPDSLKPTRSGLSIVMVAW